MSDFVSDHFHAPALQVECPGLQQHSIPLGYNPYWFLQPHFRGTLLSSTGAPRVGTIFALSQAELLNVIISQKGALLWSQVWGYDPSFLRRTSAPEIPFLILNDHIMGVGPACSMSPLLLPALSCLLYILSYRISVQLLFR